MREKSHNQKYSVVRVPATTANIGPGFDCIGAALTLYNKFKFTIEEEVELKITVEGSEAKRVSTDKTNLLYQSFVKFYEKIKQTPPQVSIEIELGVPLARGLGSSATAIVGGLMAANQLAGAPLSTRELIDLAIEAEGHPDNVVPAILGNCQLSALHDDNWHICEIPWHKEIIAVVAIPDFELSTEQARAVLPKEISRVDAIYNIAHLGFLLRGLESDRGDWLKVALEDKLHQPYRQSLIKGYASVKSAALGAGAYGMVISGAGPSLLALAKSDNAQIVASAMKKAWYQEGVTASVLKLALDTQGAQCS